MISEYQALIERLADKEPKIGFHNGSQIELSDADIAVVLKHDADVVADALSPPSAAVLASICWSLQSADRAAANTRLAELMRNCLRAEARRLVLIDLQDECDRRNGERHQSLAEERAVMWFQGEA